MNDYTWGVFCTAYDEHAKSMHIETSPVLRASSRREAERLMKDEADKQCAERGKHYIERLSRAKRKTRRKA